MGSNPFLGVVWHWTGGLSAASCYLPFRFIRRWRWEVYWMVQGCVAWILAPALLATLLVPGAWQLVLSSSHRMLFYAWFWGAMWGIGGLLFGLGVRYLGIALGYTIALGFSTAFGTLVPPLMSGELRAIISERGGQVTIAGVFACLLAIVLSGVAGRMKERELAAAHGEKDGAIEDVEDAVTPGGKGEYAFGRGILIAAFAGIMSACFSYGLAAGGPLSQASKAALLAHGRSDVLQDLPVLIVVLLGGWCTNALWCGGLFVKNRSGAELLGVGEAGVTLKNYLFAGAAGLLWYGQFFFYSMGHAQMGRYDFSSWALHMAGTIIFATLWGAALHEWKGTSARTKSVGVAGFAMLVLSTVVIGWGSYLKVQ